MSAGDQTWFLIDEHTAGKHQEHILGCASCLDHLKTGLAAAHENYLQMKRERDGLCERFWFRVRAVRIIAKERAKLHRDRAALNRENHRLLQNAHRKTLRKLERAEGMSRMERSARAADLAYLKQMGEAVKSMGLTDAVNEVRRVLWITGEFGLSKEAREGRIALDVMVARLTETAASSAPAPKRRSPSPGSGPPIAEYGCAVRTWAQEDPARGEEPWDDD